STDASGNLSSGTLLVANGGTNCTSQCWVDLSTVQAAIGGAKTFTSLLTGSAGLAVSGGNITLSGANNVIVAAGQGIDTAAAGTLNLGTTTATSVTLNNTVKTAGTHVIQPSGIANNALSIANNASAVNGVTLTGTATTVNPVLSATGTDANIGLSLTPKGTGQVDITTLTAGAVSSDASGKLSSGTLSVANGGTNCTSQCWVDLSTVQAAIGD